MEVNIVLISMQFFVCLLCVCVWGGGGVGVVTNHHVVCCIEIY